MTHLLADPFPAVFALDCVLDDGVVRKVLVRTGQGIQRNADAHEIDDPIDKDAATVSTSL